MEGVLLIDKPKGVSSFDVVHKVRKLSGQKRVGHAGTLDPLASGLLIICLGRYTKLCGYLMASHKVYETIIELGIATSTDDAEGIIEQRSDITQLTHEHIVAVCSGFLGALMQVPPKYSAIKVGGRRAYQMAREDVDFSLNSREVSIHDLAIKDISLPYVSIELHCSKGFYVRSLARDIGQALHVGAYAREIRRTRSGSFAVEQALRLDELNETTLVDNLLSGRAALGDLKVLELCSADYQNALHGRELMASWSVEDPYRMACYHDMLVAVVAMENEKARVVRGF